MKFIDLDEVLIIHERMLEIGGGREGILDFTLLHSAIERPKAQFSGEFLYQSVFEMGAALLQSLVKNHPFSDGNKRTAFFTTMRFLDKNGYEVTASNEEIVKFGVKVDINKLSVGEIAEWLKLHSKKK